MTERERLSAGVELVRGGKSHWRIFLPKGAGIVERFAAEELKRYVAAISGAELGDTGITGECGTICLGLRSDLSEVAGFLPEPKEGFDGYTILVRPDVIIIAGENQRGVLYGVYDLLEQMGCRWFHPTLDKKDPEVVPKSGDVILPEICRSEAGRIEFRIYNGSAFFAEVVPEKQIPQIDWAAKNRYNLIGWQPHHATGRVQGELEEMEANGVLAELEKRGLMLHGPCHSFPNFLPTEVYFEEHPEWFGMLNGKRQPHGGIWPAVNFCWSNEDAVEEFIKNVESFIKRWPQIRILCVEWIDGGMVCQCPECSRRGGANLIIDLFNKLSERLEMAAPGIILESVLGYPPIEGLPEDALPNGKWQGIYAHWGRNHDQSYDDPGYVRRANLLTWWSYFDDFEICSYYAATSHQPFIGPPFLHALEGDTEFIVKRGGRGHYVLHYAHGFWWNYSFNMGTAALFAYYYPGRRPKDCLRDYAFQYFGPKAGPLLADYFEMLAANLEASYRASSGRATDSDREWLCGLKRMAERAAQMAEDDEVIVYRVEKLIAGMEVMLEWSQGLRHLEKVEAAFKGYEAGEKGKGEVEKAIEGAREYAGRLIAKASEIEAAYPGTVDAKWLESWWVSRTLLNPVKVIEDKLAGLEVAGKSTKPDHVAFIDS